VRDLPDVEPFVVTAEQLSFRGAARRLAVSPAAVSKAVARLEEALGVRLLNRTTRSVALTPEGEVFLEHARMALDALQAGRDRVSRSLQTPRGLVRLSLPSILGRPVIEALPSLVQRHPHLELDLRFSDRFVRLIEDEFDLAVRIGPLRDSGLVARRLGTPRRVLVGSPAYLARAGTPRRPAELSTHTGVVFVDPSGIDTPWTLLDGGEVVTVQPSRAVRMDLGERIVDAVAAGLGLCQALDGMVADRVAAGELVEVLSDCAPAGPPVHALCVPGRQQVPAVRVVLDLLIETLG
jgi:DNA-binding transcriptional LysR family regulator